MARRARPRFRGPAADSELGEAFLDALPIVAAVGFAADVSQCVQLCGVTFRAGDRGATNDMLVQSLRLQCGARQARAAARERFAMAFAYTAVEDFDDTLHVIESSTQLIRAAYLNNLPRVLQLIQLGAPLDLVVEYGYSALTFASEQGHEHVVKALLDGKYEGRGANVNLDRNDTPLMRASLYGHEAVVRLLLSRGAKQELQDNGNDTALHWAVYGDNPVIVALLCAAPGAAAALAMRQNNGQNNGRTPLSYAIHRGRAACEAVLRAHGAPE
jgi:hypothetical protein